LTFIVFRILNVVAREMNAPLWYICLLLHFNVPSNNTSLDKTEILS